MNYNLHTDDDRKGNSGNGNGNNKDNSGSGNNGNGNSGNNGKGKGNNKKNSKSGGTDDAGYGNATNAEENNSQNQCGILFPVQEEVSATEADLIARIKTTGKEKNYELIEYLNDVNREHAEVLVEQNINGRTDTSYIYGAEINGGFDRISLDRFDGSTGYYLYDARGSVSGITNEEGQVYQSYRYSVTGEITFGAPQYENEYTYNGESYNPNIESQYLRARYYCVVTATFLTEDSYLGSQTEPLTLNRYNYCVSSYLNYTDPSGNSTENDVDRILREYPILSNQKSEQAIAVESFVNGVLGSAAKVIIDKPTAAYMPGMAMEELYGGQYRFNERAYNNYVNLTETLIEALSKDATNKTAYYAGRCTGDVVITAVGGVEFVYGLITTISGGSGSAAALATGIGIAAEPVTIAVTAEGVVTVVDGVNTIHYGITAFKKDADKGKEAKEADSKAAESGSNTTATERRNSPGVVEGNGRNTSKMMYGTDKNAGVIPKEIADKLREKQYNNFDEFRNDFWKAVAETDYANEFLINGDPKNYYRMKNGGAPLVVSNQAINGSFTYQLHHIIPINQGGSVYSVDNLVVVTPRYHAEILIPEVHGYNGFKQFFR